MTGGRVLKPISLLPGAVGTYPEPNERNAGQSPRGGGEAGQSAEAALHRLPRTARQRPGFVSANIPSRECGAGD
jgi:hypothetical protein